jgi:malate dehydrogenase
MLDGEYGLNNICIGVPVIVGTNGVEEIIEINLDDIENEKLQNSAAAVTKMNFALKNILN